MKAIAAIAVLAFAGSAAAQNSPDDLIQAIRTDNLALLKSRLTKGADVNARDSRGDTLLMLAAAYGTPEAVKLLLDAGADVKAKNQFDATALIFGANHPQKARMLVEKGADVNARSKQGRTPLMIAATCDGCVDTVRLLIGKGADVKAKDFRDTTALYSASEANDIDTIQLLLEKGADPDSGGVGGYTALMSAASFCNLPAIRLLLSKGADVNAASTFGGRVKFGPIQLIHITPLMAAAPYCQADVLRALLDAGAKINEKDSRNMTALMLALGSEHQDPEVVSLLLSSRADPNVISTMGETALDWAQKFGNRQIIAVLRAGGARTGDAFTPPERKSSGARSVRQAVESAVALLQRSSTEFFKQSGCVGCHHQPFTTMAVAAAHANGVGFDETAAKEQIGMIKALEIQRQEPLLERIETGGFTDPPVYSLLAAGAAQFPASLDTDTVSLYVAGAQHRDGTWRLPEFPRAPSAEGVIARTAFTARVLQLYGSPAKKSA
ncbi:MAG: ankyrin repeat domain-containing protein [Acidobacteriia bacterium]|nr:ankyrin repeat domain-containing protein [Terriglobia bacterium]